jgi:Na+-transporting methylmalonyl-CoA/oxaloacetate decarboxylase gamma subunit
MVSADRTSRSFLIVAGVGIVLLFCALLLLALNH